MNEDQKILLKAKIETKIKEMEEKIFQLEKMTQPIAPENSIGRISRMDAINNKSVAEAALRTAKTKHAKLKIARGKIETDPGFGYCSNCSGLIPEGRLMLLPESTSCVKCAR